MELEEVGWGWWEEVGWVVRERVGGEGGRLVTENVDFIY